VKNSGSYSCNILLAEPARRHLWRFEAENSKVKFSGEHTVAADQPLPARWVAKDWHTLFQQKLNIAWLPTDQVFLRVLQMPMCEFAELLTMLEFQLEKISPIPPAQMVWSVELAPPNSAIPSNLQTVVVIILPRVLVEEFLGQLEGNGYLADRLEVPYLHQLLSAPVEGEGTWLSIAKAGEKLICMAAWWYGGALQNINLLHLTAPDQFSREVGDPLTQTIWAGELEGWLHVAPVWHLVAEPETAAVWLPAIEEWANQMVEVTPLLAGGDLARVGAGRLARGESRMNLLPAEFATRYRQQFIDRIWMRLLAAILGIYVIGVGIFFAALQVARYQQNRLQNDLAGLTPEYIKSQELKAKIAVARTQASLKFAALDSYKAVTDKLPGGLALQGLTFSRGRTLSLAGVADDARKVTDYNEELTRVEINGEKFFARVELKQTRTGPGQFGPNTTSWAIECELNSREGD
jgi:hypothetical protein